MATDVVLAYFLYITFSNFLLLHLFHLAFHRDDKTNFQLLKHICVDSYWISQLGYTLQIFFLLLNSTQRLCFSFSINNANGIGAWNNTPSDHLLVAILKILTFEPTSIWTIKRQFVFLTWQAARMAISLLTVKIVISEQPTFSENWVTRKTSLSASYWLELN